MLTDKELFIEEMWISATFVRDTLGMPINVPVAVAQAALETGYGQSVLARNCNNLFGVKGQYQGQGCIFETREFRDGEWVTERTEFREYNSWTDSFRDYADLISRLSWYQDAEDAAGSPFDYLRGLLVKYNEAGELEEAGWATDPQYEQKIIAIMARHNLIVRDRAAGLLQVYDGDKLLELQILKQTVQPMEDGGTKLQVRVVPTKTLKRARYLLGLDKNPGA